MRTGASQTQNVFRVRMAELQWVRRKLVKEVENMPTMRGALRSGQGDSNHFEHIKQLRIHMQYRWLQPSLQVRVG